MLNNQIMLKGCHFILTVINLYDIHLHRLKKILQKKIKESPNFFKHAPIILNIQYLSHPVNWLYIKEIFISVGFLVAGVTKCNNEKLKNIIIKSGTPILSEGSETLYSKNNNKKLCVLKRDICQKKPNKTSIITTPVRSGQKIYSNNSDLIITNRVSEGAELISDGNIHIYGVMCGRALAGANGDNTRKIFSTKFFAELVSISGEYWTKDNIPVKYIGKTIEISNSNDSLIIKELK